MDKNFGKLLLESLILQDMSNEQLVHKLETEFGIVYNIFLKIFEKISPPSASLLGESVVLSESDMSDVEIQMETAKSHIVLINQTISTLKNRNNVLVIMSSLIRLINRLNEYGKSINGFMEEEHLEWIKRKQPVENINKHFQKTYNEFWNAMSNLKNYLDSDNELKGKTPELLINNIIPKEIRKSIS